jgi:predicted glycogen debranching enzyme
MIEIGKEIGSDLQGSTSREWLETNGIGGYASGTIAGANSRRYHGLLVAATRPPLGRMVLLSKFEESVTFGGRIYELSSNRYPGTVYPTGYKYITSFRLDPFPIWTYEIDGLVIERSIFMIAGRNTTVCQWKVRDLPIGKTAPTLDVRPLTAFRDHHHLRHKDAKFDTAFDAESGLVTIQPVPDAPTLYFTHNAVGTEASGLWYRNFEYSIEQERGFDYSEDLFQPFVLRFSLEDPANVIVSSEGREDRSVKTLRNSELVRRAKLIAAARVEDGLRRQLVLAADQFIVDRGKGKTVIAGYHWFSDWGRDTMIALPGLTLSTARSEIAKSIILEFSEYISQGMLPNRFPDMGETPEYNTVDATLWYFEAIMAYVEATGDEKTASGLFDKLADVIDWHILGTRYGIRVDDDALLNAGEPGVQLTWMDAKVGEHVVTPRTGKPVEIQALWYNALCIMAEFAHRFGHDSLEERYRELAENARKSFAAKFWYEAGGYLYDVINGDDRDPSLRPNQIIAVSLRHPILEGERAGRVIDIVEERLLTPFGLRTLDPDDPQYVGTYTGSPAERDSAYHQGTVWAWLIGHFIDGYIKTHAGDKNLKDRVSEFLAGFEPHLSEAGLGQVSEIFDADPPHLPRGCIAQAWGVAEVLRVLTQKLPA